MYPKSPFEPLTKEEKLKRENEAKELTTSINATIKSASELLSDPRAKAYREEFQEMQREIFLKLKTPIWPDPIQDAYYLRACINTWIVLDMILSKPEEDIQKKRPT